jgi:acetyl esterase/lipase
MNNEQRYQELLGSLMFSRKICSVAGVDIEIRDCFDRIPGKLDPRTALVLGLTREEFEKKFNLYDEELWPNGIHILGPQNTEGRTRLEIYRISFGWKSNDLSHGVSSSFFCIPSKKGPVTIYRYEPTRRQQPSPCLIFFHGGGFFAGNIATVENQCKLIAERAGALVLSVDYPLAPESPFPAGFNCCYAAVEYAHDNADSLGIDGAKIGVSGDSAGGNLAAACALRNRDEGRWPLAYQALIYPTLSRAEKTGDPYRYWKADKYDNPQNDPVIAFQSSYIGGQNSELNGWYVPIDTNKYIPYLSPIAASAEGLPKTLIITAEYDFLRIECEEYSGMLKKAHIPNRHIRYGGITHGTFDRLGYAPQVEDMVNEIAKDLRSL